MSSTLVSPSLPAGALALPDWGVIRATGSDARTFLNGQLTTDLLALAPGQARLAGYCSAKGRLLASFVVWPVADDQLLLACSADLLAATLKRLSMYVLRAKCKLSDASAECPVQGLAGATVQEVAGQSLAPWQVTTAASAHVIGLPDAVVDGQAVPRALLVGPPAAATAAAPVLDASAWLALEACSGVPRVVAATVEQFVPQMINLELVGGVDFRKGCYPGQEVVARSQYRGTLKRRGYALRGAQPMTPGQDIYHSADPGQPAGQVVLAGSLGMGQFDALAELKLSAVSDGTLHLGSADGPPLQLSTLPYAVPADSA